jgi:putative photosynthetic complex assembly protein
MSDAFDAHSVPRLPLAGAGALVLVSLVAVAALRLSGAPPMSVAPSPVTVERQLQFRDAAAGGVDVIDAASGRRLKHLEPGADGFIRATVRSLARARRAQHVGAEMPFVLASHADGRLTLADPATGRSINLEAFGPDNAGAFARLLAAQAAR